MDVNKKRLLAYSLQYFAEGSGGEKTEEATTKKLGDARKEGQVARSTELNTGVSLVVIFLSLKYLVGYLSDGFLEGFLKYYGMIASVAGEPFQGAMAHTITKDVLIKIMALFLPMGVISMVTMFVVVVWQVKWKISGKPLEPKFSKFSPAQGLKRMFSKDKIMELIKSLLKIGVIAYMVYSQLSSKIGVLKHLYTVSLFEAVSLIGNLVIDLGLNISMLFLGIGCFDYFYQKWKFKKDLRMTKQEVRDEYKQTEGDPQIKGRIRQKMREVSNQRMMKRLPEADVVITNPTHLAVAIKYDKASSGAPIVIAKGADHLAKRIREVAKENKIEIVENKPLARMLYFNVDLEQEIPQDLYQAVAEVLAYVYKLKNQS